jgi:hypothetical protein
MSLRVWMAALLVALALPPDAARAQSSSPPACTESREGAVACMVQKLCVCRFQRGGSLTGRPDGFRWDCGALRPSCGAEANPPATLPSPQPMPMPQLYLEVPRQPPYPPHR